jgi:predicted amidohydrolase
MLCNQAKEKKVWIIGGSIPERDVDDKLYNTCVIINDTGNTSIIIIIIIVIIIIIIIIIIIVIIMIIQVHLFDDISLLLSFIGDIVGKHRKVHLFDIDVPGKHISDHVHRIIINIIIIKFMIILYFFFLR